MSADRRGGEAMPAMVWRPVALVASLAGVVHLVVATRFGWHVDELYNVVAGRHLAWGYPDLPPLVPLIARVLAVFPGGVLPLRLAAIACQLGCIVLAAMLVRELGGGRRAQALAAGCIAASPVFIGSSLLFGTTVTDQLAWAATFVLVARSLRRGTIGAWILTGVVVGSGLENKQTVAVLLGGTFVGLWWARREVLRAIGPLLAGAVAMLIWAPNLAWDATHHWQNLTVATSITNLQGGIVRSLTQIPVLALVLLGPALVVIWYRGVRWLTSADHREHSWLIAVTIVAVVVFTLGGGKPYYPAPAFIGLFAAGSIVTDERIAAGVTSWRRWAGIIAIEGMVASILLLPYLPITLIASPGSPTFFLNTAAPETYGWPAFAAQVAHAAATERGVTSIFAGNYGEAAVLDYYGKRAGLAVPVYSAHNAYANWGPPRTGDPDDVLVVGKYTRAELHKSWRVVTVIAPIVLPRNVQNNETSSEYGPPASIFVCRAPKGTWAQLWPKLTRFDSGAFRVRT